MVKNNLAAFRLYRADNPLLLSAVALPNVLRAASGYRF